MGTAFRFLQLLPETHNVSLDLLFGLVLGPHNHFVRLMLDLLRVPDELFHIAADNMQDRDLLVVGHRLAQIPGECKEQKFLFPN